MKFNIFPNYILKLYFVLHFEWNLRTCLFKSYSTFHMAGGTALTEEWYSFDFYCRFFFKSHFNFQSHVIIMFVSIVCSKIVDGPMQHQWFIGFIQVMSCYTFCYDFISYLTSFCTDEWQNLKHYYLSWII